MKGSKDSTWNSGDEIQALNLGLARFANHRLPFGGKSRLQVEDARAKQQVPFSFIGLWFSLALSENGNEQKNNRAKSQFESRSMGPIREQQRTEFNAIQLGK